MPPCRLLGFALFGALAADVPQAQARTEFPLEESAIECIEAIGSAPEHRAMARRRTNADPGPMAAFVVKVPESAAADIRATFGDIAASPHAGFDRTRSGAIRLLAPAIDPGAGATTQLLPRDGFLMFTMSRSVVERLRTRRSRCGARESFDPTPFEKLHRAVRGILRGMLDRERR